jgi:1,4-dihydroxy-2-naphthoyl-CoA hydrolase
VTEPPVTRAKPIEGTMDAAIGFRHLGGERGTAHGEFEVTDNVRQPYGIVHGGAYAAAAESLASGATYAEVSKEGMLAMGQSNHTSFLRPVSEGIVHAEATARHRGRTTWVWEVEFTDDDGRLLALSRVTMAVRPETGS